MFGSKINWESQKKESNISERHPDFDENKAYAYSFADAWDCLRKAENFDLSLHDIVTLQASDYSLIVGLVKAKLKVGHSVFDTISYNQPVYSFKAHAVSAKDHFYSLGKVSNDEEF
jgi:hypothetical protein